MIIHITRINSSGDVYGHEEKYCDEAGCAGLEHYFEHVNGADVLRGNVYEIDPDGVVVAEVGS